MGLTELLESRIHGIGSWMPGVINAVLDPDNPAMYLNSIFVQRDARRKGYARRAMESLTEFADEYHLDTYLVVSPSMYLTSFAPDPLMASRESLVAFYWEFNFTIYDDGANPLMMRPWQKIESTRV